MRMRERRRFISGASREVRLALREARENRDFVISESWPQADVLPTSFCIVASAPMVIESAD